MDCIAVQAPLSMGFSGQEHWSGLPCPPPGDLPNPGTEPVSHVSCVSRRVLYHLRHPGSPTAARTHGWLCNRPCFPQGLGERRDAPALSGATGDASSRARSCRPVGGEGSPQDLAGHFRSRPQTLRRCRSLLHWRQREGASYSVTN